MTPQTSLSPASSHEYLAARAFCLHLVIDADSVVVGVGHRRPPIVLSRLRARMDPVETPPWSLLVNRISPAKRAETGLCPYTSVLLGQGPATKKQGSALLSIWGEHYYLHRCRLHAPALASSLEKRARAYGTLPATKNSGKKRNAPGSLYQARASAVASLRVCSSSRPRAITPERADLTNSAPLFSESVLGS